MSSFNQKTTRKEWDSIVQLDHMDVDHARDATLRSTKSAAFSSNSSTDNSSIDHSGTDNFAKQGHNLKIKSLLGEGGMGLIKLAEQRTLRRDVAVKVLRDEFIQPMYIQRLVREARITGLVEHPNVVPIHGLHMDERGAPMMEMKHIEGVSWRAMIRDPYHTAFPRDADDRLAWHVGVLMEVCDAVHYAHSRGVLHLDLKPDNVMIGQFRDVYLVDWGVAVTTNEVYRGALPMADEICEVIGTPAYLAPEMVDIAQNQLTKATDVYLLGSTLHEVLTGSPPHQADSLHDTLYAAHESKPLDYPATVPRELCAIARRAMHAVPEERFESAEAFRQALAMFLSHRSSTALSNDAARRLAQLRQEVSAGPPETDPALQKSTWQESTWQEKEAYQLRTQRIQRLFSECRFSFARALREWPENDVAQTGLTEALIMMAEYHLQRKDAGAAAALVEEIDPAMVSHFEEPLGLIKDNIASARAQKKQLQRFSQEQDQTEGRRARAFFVLVCMFSLIIPIILTFVLQQLDLYTFQLWHSFVFSGVLVSALGTIAFVRREDLMPNETSRKLFLALMLLGGCIAAQRILAARFGYVDITNTAFDFLLFGAGCGVIGVLWDRQFFAITISFVTSAFLASVWPQWLLLFLLLATMTGPGFMVYRWLRQAKHEPTSAPVLK